MAVEHFYYYHTIHNTKNGMEKTNTIHNTKNIIQKSQKIPFLPFHTLLKLYKYDVEKAQKIPFLPYHT